MGLNQSVERKTVLLVLCKVVPVDDFRFFCAAACQQRSAERVPNRIVPTRRLVVEKTAFEPNRAIEVSDGFIVILLCYVHLAL